jgi:DeoR family transcriptional regulator of aga operon
MGDKRKETYYNDIKRLSTWFQIYINPKDMSTIQKRHQTIIELLKQKGGRLSVNDLSDRLGVSSVTIRQDLRTLADKNVLERVYGGAVLRSGGSGSVELSFEVRQQEAARDKNAIGRFAAQLVKDGYGIAIDGSTTAFALVPYLKQYTNLTIVTNSLIVAQGFRDTPRNKVYVPCGRMRGESATIVGSPEGLPDINLNFGFFGAWGVSLPGGISDVDPDEVKMRRAMMTRCLKTVVIVDGRKWGETAPYTYATADEIDRIITSTSAPDDLVEAFRQRGVIVDMVSASFSNAIS